LVSKASTAATPPIARRQVIEGEVCLPPNTRRSGQAADDNIADIGPLCEYRKMEGKHILAIVLGALVAGIAIEARVKK
jgi:hypothetical protein